MKKKYDFWMICAVCTTTRKTSLWEVKLAAFSKYFNVRVKDEKSHLRTHTARALSKDFLFHTQQKHEGFLIYGL